MNRMGSVSCHLVSPYFAGLGVDGNWSYLAASCADSHVVTILSLQVMAKFVCSCAFLSYGLNVFCDFLCVSFVQALFF